MTCPCATCPAPDSEFKLCYALCPRVSACERGEPWEGRPIPGGYLESKEVCRVCPKANTAADGLDRDLPR
jgi:hypothetical protein